MNPMIKAAAALFLVLLCRAGLGQEPRLVLPVGHFEEITFASYSPDEKKIVTASTDDVAKIWDANNGNLLADLKGHKDNVNSAVFSPDGKKILTASRDGTARIWDVTNGKLLRILSGHTESVDKAIFTPDGQKIITISFDKTVRVWNALTGKLQSSLKNHSGSVQTVSYDPEGKKILTSFADNSVRIWGLDRGLQLMTLKSHTEPINVAFFSPDGKKIITCSQDKTAKLWDTGSGKLLVTLKGHEEEINFAAFSPDEDRIITCSQDATAKVWNSRTGALQFTLEPIDVPVSAQFSPDGSKIVIGSFGEASIWNSMDGELLNSPEAKFIMPTDFRLAWVNAVFTPDGTKILITAENGGIEMWDVQQKLNTDLEWHQESITSVFFNKDGSRFITTSADNTTRIWDARSGSILVNLKSHTTFPTVSFFTKDQKKILTVYDDSIVRLWDVNKGVFSSGLKHKYRVNWASLSPDGKKILTSSEDSVALVWDTETSAQLYALGGHKGEVKSANFSRDGHLIVTVARYDDTVRIWDVQTGLLTRSFEIDLHTWLPPEIAEFSMDRKRIIVAAMVNDVFAWDISSGDLLFNVDNEHPIISRNRWNVFDLHPDNKRIAIASNDIIELREIQSGKVLATLKGHSAKINSIYFSNDGKKIVTASYDGTACVWDVQSRKLLVRCIGHSENVRMAIFSSDEKKILTASEDFTARIWDAQTGRLLVNLKDHAGWIHTAFFSPDGTKVVTTSGDHTSKLWNAADGKLIYTFFPVDSAGYFIQIPSGYYQSTFNASKLLHYVTKDLKVITFEQLDIKYNRPDKVLEAIGNTDTALIKSYRKAWEKRIKKLGIDTTQFRDGYSVPEADFVNRDNIEYEQKNGTLSLQIKGMDSTYQLDRFNVWVNETPLFGQRGISIRKKNKNSIDTTITITLSQGENRIETSITNVNGTESYRMPLTVNYTPAVRQKEMLRFIGIGIDQFSDSQYNLQYSSKDIRDLAKKLKEKYNENIIIDTLFNENVTTVNVKALKQKLQQATVNDKVIISYSGHGLLSKDFDYYLSTYSTNFIKPEENGLPYEELENLLDSIPARKKLLLIDACHSGEVDKEELKVIDQASDSLKLIKGLKPVGYADESHLGLKNSFELMQNLFVNVGKSTGATVISAAAGTQFALERNDLKNGVFTYSILEAMQKNPTMKISELKKIVGERVEQLTNGLQKPTSRNETIAVDWSIW